MSVSGEYSALNTMTSAKQTETATCPFPDCDWSKDYDPNDYHSELSKDFRAESHYEQEHAGRVRIQVTLEKQQMLGERSTDEIRERLSDEDFVGWDVAHVMTEVTEEADDHSKITRGGGGE